MHTFPKIFSETKVHWKYILAVISGVPNRIYSGCLRILATERRLSLKLLGMLLYRNSGLPWPLVIFLSIAMVVPISLCEAVVMQ